MPEAIADLSTEQQQAYETILGRLHSKERFTSLRGFAGTGKTYLVGRLVETLLGEDQNVFLCAPTHKAAAVLRRTVPAAAHLTRTLHSFLGLRLKPDLEGGYRLEPEGDRSLPLGAVVIVDEASMVGREEWQYIEPALGIWWLFVGDPAQLPPVNEDASQALNLPGATLSTIVRQAADNPIIQLATRIRQGELSVGATNFSNGHGVGVTERRSALVEAAVRAFSSSSFERNPSTARILAYRNRTVRAYNRQIRALLHGEDVPRFVEGEWLVGRNTWWVDETVQLLNSEEVRLLDMQEEVSDDGVTGRWKVWNLLVEGGEQPSDRELVVLHESEHERFQERLGRWAKEAREGEREWEDFYTLKERFAEVDYAYAQTIHKAQGSTFESVFVDLRDTLACRPEEERQALVYVAVTRPARRLGLLK